MIPQATQSKTSDYWSDTVSKAELQLALIDSVIAQDASKVGELLKLGLNVNYKNVHQQTALHAACFLGNISIVQMLLDARADPAVKDNAGNTPFHFACTKGHTAIICLLLDTGGRSQNQGSFSLTAFQQACTYQTQEVVELLVQRKAFTQSELAIALYLAHGRNKPELLQLLLERVCEQLEEPVERSYCSPDRTLPDSIVAKEPELIQAIEWEGEEVNENWEKLRGDIETLVLSKMSLNPVRSVTERAHSWLKHGLCEGVWESALERFDVEFYQRFLRTPLGKKLTAQFCLLLSHPKYCVAFAEENFVNNELCDAFIDSCAGVYTRLDEMGKLHEYRSSDDPTSIAPFYPKLLKLIVNLIYLHTQQGTCRGRSQAAIISHIFQERTGKELDPFVLDSYSLYHQSRGCSIRKKRSIYLSVVKPLRHLLPQETFQEVQRAFSSYRTTTTYLIRANPSFDEGLKNAIYNPSARALMFYSIYKGTAHCTAVTFGQKITFCDSMFNAKFTYKNQEMLFQDLQRYFRTTFPDSESTSMAKRDLSSLSITTYL